MSKKLGELIGENETTKLRSKCGIVKIKTTFSLETPIYRSENIQCGSNKQKEWIHDNHEKSKNHGKQ